MWLAPEVLPEKEIPCSGRGGNMEILISTSGAPEALRENLPIIHIVSEFFHIFSWKRLLLANP
jgi:hypothetical protein